MQFPLTIFSHFSHPSQDAVIAATVVSHKLQSSNKKSKARKRKDSDDSDSDGVEAINNHVSANLVECNFFAVSQQMPFLMRNFSCR